MVDSGRKGLVWSIKKSLLTLTAHELFQLAQSVGPVPGKDSSMLQVGEEESCFEYILAFMYSENLVESEDSGMAVLLELNNTVHNVIQSCNIQSKTGTETNVHNTLSTPVLSENVTAGQPGAMTDNMTASVPNTNTTHTARVSLSSNTYPPLTHADAKTTHAQS